MKPGPTREKGVTDTWQIFLREVWESDDHPSVFKTRDFLTELKSSIREPLEALILHKALSEDWKLVFGWKPRPNFYLVSERQDFYILSGGDFYLQEAILRPSLALPGSLDSDDWSSEYCLPLLSYPEMNKKNLPQAYLDASCPEYFSGDYEEIMQIYFDHMKIPYPKGFNP